MSIFLGSACTCSLSNGRCELTVILFSKLLNMCNFIWHFICIADQSILYTDRQAFSSFFHFWLLLIVYFFIPVISLCEIVLILLSDAFRSNNSSDHHSPHLHHPTSSVKVHFRLFLTVSILCCCLADIGLVLISPEEYVVVSALTFFSFLQMLFVAPLAYHYYVIEQEWMGTSKHLKREESV